MNIIITVALLIISVVAYLFVAMVVGWRVHNSYLQKAQAKERLQLTDRSDARFFGAICGGFWPMWLLAYSFSY